MSEGRVEALYAQLKEMTVNFRLRPGERLNEVMLARELDASRTPLREALNRLVAEQLIDFQPGKGFFWCARRSWRVPAGESPARVRGSARPVASVAAVSVTIRAKRTQQACGVWN